jgi:hypothetical protein
MRRRAERVSCHMSLFIFVVAQRASPGRFPMKVERVSVEIRCLRHLMEVALN